jgi:tRNA pseudouridine65 synthase
MDLHVLYRDKYLIVVDKPVNLPVHKNDFMPHDAPYLTKLLGEMEEKWIHNVHRLDSKTSGVIVLAFSKEVAHELTLQFERKEVDKTYYALVLGNPGEGTFNSKVLVKKKSRFKKAAVTHFETLKTVTTDISYKDKKNVQLSLVEIKTETGRWHQIRQHFAQNRFDIVGDTHHGDFTLNKIITTETGAKRLMLHAGKLGFTHPETGMKLNISAELPPEIEVVLKHYSNTEPNANLSC